MRSVNYGLIISDFDGTLAGGDSTVSERNKKAIFEYIENGGIFAVSTGRLPVSILTQVQSLGLKGLISCGQGAVIMDIESEKIIFESRMPFESALTVCRKMEELGLHILAFDLWDFYSNQDNDALKLYEKIVNNKAIVISECKLSDFLQENKMSVCKLMALVEPKDNAKILKQLKDAALPDCEFTKSMDFFVEALNPKYSKGTALEFLAEKYGIPIEKTIAIGDNLNDLSMIERAGLGVAVANADGDLKKRADYVSEYTNDEYAVADIIEKFGFM